MTTYGSAFFISVSLAACGANSPPPTSAREPTHDQADRTNAGSAVTRPTPAPPPDKPPEPDPMKVKADLLASETAAWETAKPVFVTACASCHTKAGKKSAQKKLDHMDMDTYPIGGHHTGTIGYKIRDVLGLSGKRATMPYNKPGSVQGDALEKIKLWTDAWEAADKGGAHPPAAPEKDDD